MELSPRKSTILKLIVDRYVRTGEPVGSKAICEDVSLSLSSATVRNEMSDLAQMGLIDQPHTSSGRVPTEAGYRIYVEKLMKRRPLSLSEERRIAGAFPHRIESPDSLLGRACRTLADLTHCTAIATTPSDAQSGITRVELIRVGGSVCILVLMTSSGMIQNRMCRLPESIGGAQLERFSRIATAVLGGLALCETGAGAVQTLAAAVGIDALELTPVITELYHMVQEGCQTSLCTDGELHLFADRHLTREDAGALIRLFSTKERLIQLLSNPSAGTEVRIGSDLPAEPLQQFCLISTRYSFAGSGGGRIGIIGPIHLDYSRAISYVESVANTVDAILV